MKTVIISGGRAPSYELLKEELKDATYLICADSGANCLYDYKIKPNFILGDLDSIDKKVLEYFKSVNVDIIKYPPEKDWTDTEIAINKAKELKSTDVVMLGSTGTRIDHLLGNIGMLLKSLKLGINSYIKDENNTITIKDKRTILKGNMGKVFSISAYYNNVENLNIKGAKYPLENYNLEIGNPITISNEFLDDEVEISFDSGIVLINFPKD